MAKFEETRTRRTGETGTQEMPLGAAGLTSLDPIFRAGNRLLEGWMAVSSEMLEFGKHRFDRGLEVSKAIAQSSSLNEAIDLQATFTRSIVQEYVSEAQKIADLGTRSLLDSMSTLQQQARDTQIRESDRHAQAAE